MKIVTWNVNSIRTRLERAKAWVAAHQPDVLCLQEIKVVDEVFPREVFEGLGYHVETYGQKTYNGVAILSRSAPTDVVRGLPHDGPDAEARAISATIDGVRVICVYVPNGKKITSDKFAYKLDWLTRLLENLDTTCDPEAPLVLLGDFNIAPEDRDVYDPEAWRGKVHFHPVEHAMLDRIKAWGLRDVYRKHEESAGKYSWWDYRGGAFPRDRGLRIDLVLATESAYAACTACEIDREERKEPKGADKPSDHAPVVATFDF